MSEETLAQIPVEIERTTKHLVGELLTNPYLDRLEVRDYEWELISSYASKHYDYASIEEIFRVAARGTEIALEMLGDPKTRNETWGTDGRIVDAINRRIQKYLLSDRERNLSLHYVCNSMFIVKKVETVIRRMLNHQIDGGGRGILDFLYEIEKTGNFGEAWQHFLDGYELHI